LETPLSIAGLSDEFKYGGGVISDWVVASVVDEGVYSVVSGVAVA
jgi:hypothetical protein